MSKSKNKCSIKHNPPVCDKLKLLSDNELFNELKAIVNKSRFTNCYNRELARAIGEECSKRGWLNKVHGLDNIR